MPDVATHTELSSFRIRFDTAFDGGGGQRASEKIIPTQSSVIAVSALPIGDYGDRYEVTLAYVIPDLRDFIPDVVLNLVIDTVEVVVATAAWDSTAIDDSNIIAKQQFRHVNGALNAASGSAFAIVRLSPNAASVDRQWCVLLRASGSQRTDGTIIAPVRLDFGFIRFVIPGGIAQVNPSDVLGGRIDPGIDNL